MLNVAKQTGSKLLIITCVMMSSLLSVACSSTAVGQTTGKPQATETKGTMEIGKIPGTQRAVGMRLSWNAIHSWAIWLDNPDLAQLEASHADLLVIDSSADGSAARAFSPAQIQRLRQTHAGRRVVAYLSIGEAEDYRGYWQQGWRPGTPSWLRTEDSDWSGNYWVNYWEPAWQQVISRYLDSIIDAGFDGIYLDRIDAYQESYASGHEDDMVRFVANLARYARTRSPLGEDFGIIVQNAEELAGKYPDYVRLVTGIGREEVYMQATNQPTSEAARASVENDLDLFLRNSRGKLVLTVDYATKPDLICSAYRLARVRGYVPYVTRVSLDRLAIDPGC